MAAVCLFIQNEFYIFLTGGGAGAAGGLLFKVWNRNSMFLIFFFLVCIGAGTGSVCGAGGAGIQWPGNSNYYGGNYEQLVC